jgi:S1-C subfamily serine protease
MKKITYLTVCFLISSFLFFSGTSFAKADIKTSMVKIYTTQTPPDYDNPWQVDSPVLTSGSGCVINEDKILTNAHVVSNQTYIQVSRYGESTKYKANVFAVSHEADLALLTVEEKEFFRDVNKLDLGELPNVQDEVVVYGFPEGGETLCLTKGVISRIEQNKYSHSALEFLAIQIDAAINSGNSGGPVMKGEKIIGIATQTKIDSENMAYIVPTPIINHFLKDLEDGQYDGFPKVGLITQSMENEALKNIYGLNKRDSGILVASVIPGSPGDGIIRTGDVIISIDGNDIANDGTVEFRPNERTKYDYCVQQHQIGEKIPLEIIRNTIKRKLEITLNTTMKDLRLVPLARYDVLPTYYVYCGLVFTPLTFDYIKTWGDEWYLHAPSKYTSLLVNDLRSTKGEEVVILSKVLPHDINNGYHNMSDCIITEVNGKKIHNLNELVRIIEGDTEKRFVEFRTKQDKHIVLDREKATGVHAEILEIYGVTVAKSLDLELDKGMLPKILFGELEKNLYNAK